MGGCVAVYVIAYSCSRMLLGSTACDVCLQCGVNQHVSLLTSSPLQIIRKQTSEGIVYKVKTTSGGSGPNKGKPTYGRVNLSAVNGYNGNVTYSRLVCAAFHGPAPSTDHVVNHIDGNIRNVSDHVWWSTRLPFI